MAFRPRSALGCLPDDSDFMALAAVIDVPVGKANRKEFLEASLALARASVRREQNLRFDLIQSLDNPGKFSFFEVYEDVGGFEWHHNVSDARATWRASLEPMLVSPKEATFWKALFPNRFASEALILERPTPSYFEIRQTTIISKLGKESKFIEATMEYVENIQREADCLRVDFMQNLERPSKFLLRQVYRSREGVKLHTNQEHSIKWRQDTKKMRAKPAEAEAFSNHFPNLPAGWSIDG